MIQLNQKESNQKDCTTRTGKDCVIVALANYTQKSYDEVLKDIYSICDITKENHYKSGFFHTTYIALYEKYVGRKAVMLKGFRGNNITGLVRLKKPGRNTGHLVMAVLGTVYDYDGSVNPISHFRELGYSVKNVWM